MSQLYVYDDEIDLRRAPLKDDRRMYVRSNVSLPCGEIDPRTLRPINSYRPGRVQAMQISQREREKELEKERNRKGVYIPFRVAAMMIAAVMFILGVLAISQYGQLTAQQKLINSQTNDIEACIESIDDLTQQITLATDEADICKAASQELDMIRGDSAGDNTITILAVSARPQSAEQAAQELNAVAMAAQAHAARAAGN